MNQLFATQLVKENLQYANKINSQPVKESLQAERLETTKQLTKRNRIIFMYIL